MRKRLSESTIKRYQPYFDENGIITYRSLKDSNPGVFAKLKGIPEDLDQPWLDINNGAPLSDWWVDISALKNGFITDFRASRNAEGIRVPGYLNGMFSVNVFAHPLHWYLW